ncbi:MAG: hypothetical protein WCV58_01715 [Patescibacteria group bacterium]
MAALRRFIFNLLAVSDYRRTPPSLLNIVGEEFKWYRSIRIECNLPSKLQFVSNHPDLVSRLISEFPQLSASQGGITCGQDMDFVREIREGTAGSLGHFWEHVAAQAFDDVSSQLGYGDHQFVWSTARNRSRSKWNKTVYTILCFHEVQPPPEFNGLESLVTGCLNALYEGNPFFLTERLKEFVDHRTDRSLTI